MKETAFVFFDVSSMLSFDALSMNVSAGWGSEECGEGSFKRKYQGMDNQIAVS